MKYLHLAQWSNEPHIADVSNQDTDLIISSFPSSDLIKVYPEANKEKKLILINALLVKLYDNDFTSSDEKEMTYLFLREKYNHNHLNSSPDYLVEVAIEKLGVQNA